MHCVEMEGRKDDPEVAPVPPVLEVESSIGDGERYGEVFRRRR